MNATSQALHHFDATLPSASAGSANVEGQVVGWWPRGCGPLLLHAASASGAHQRETMVASRLKRFQFKSSMLRDTLRRSCRLAGVWRGKSIPSS